MKSICYKCEHCRGNANDPGFLAKEEDYCEWCEEESDNFLTPDGCWMFSIIIQPDPDKLEYYRELGRSEEE